MSTILAYDIKAKKKVQMNDPQPYLMKNGTWALKGTSSETGIRLFKIVGKTKPAIGQETAQSRGGRIGTTRSKVSHRAGTAQSRGGRDHRQTLGDPFRIQKMRMWKGLLALFFKIRATG